MINKLSGNDLRKRIAELEGWTEIGPQYGVLFGKTPTNGFISIIPCWHTGAEAAMELVDKMNQDTRFSGVWLVYDRIQRLWYAELETHRGEPFIYLVETDPDIKLAVCRLYVQWRELQETKS